MLALGLLVVGMFGFGDLDAMACVVGVFEWRSRDLRFGFEAGGRAVGGDVCDWGFGCKVECEVGAPSGE